MGKGLFHRALGSHHTLSSSEQVASATCNSIHFPYVLDEALRTHRRLRKLWEESVATQSKAITPVGVKWTEHSPSPRRPATLSLWELFRIGNSHYDRNQKLTSAFAKMDAWYCPEVKHNRLGTPGVFEYERDGSSWSCGWRAYHERQMERSACSRAADDVLFQLALLWTNIGTSGCVQKMVCTNQHQSVLI